MPTLKPHLLLDPGSDYAGWKDITGDVLPGNIRWVQGNTSNDPRDRVAQTGAFMFELDNSSDNDAGIAGYYSPGHSDCMAGFEIGARVRWEYQTDPGQDPAFIIATDTPTSDVYNTDTQIYYCDVAKTDNSFFDGLYYPSFTSNTFAIHDTDESTIIQGLDLNNHTIAYWVKVNASSDTEMPELSVVISSTDEVFAMTERMFTTVTATDATYYPSVIRTCSDGVGAWNVTVVNSDFTVTTDWCHVAMTVCASDLELRMYVNGVAITGAITSDVLTNSTDTYKQYSIKLGSNLGSMAHVAIWNDVLTSDEIYGLYSLGEWAQDAHYAIAHEAPLVYYKMGALASHAAADHYEQNRAIRYTWAQLEAGYKPCMGYYKFNGRVASIDIAPGKFGERKVSVECVDWMDDASNVVVSNIPVMVNYTADEVLMMMILHSGVSPTMTDFDTGQTLSYTAGAKGSQNTLYSEMKRVCESEPGYAYVRGGCGSDGEIGGVLTFEAKSTRFEKTTTDAAFGDDEGSDAPYSIDVVRNIDRLINAAEITVHPVEIDAVAVPIYTMTSDMTPTIPAYGEMTITCKYTDTDEAYELVGAVDVVQPIRNVDYTINARADGLGNDTSQDIRAVIAATEEANLIQYLIGYEKNGYVLTNYKAKSTAVSTSVSSTVIGSTGSTSVTVVSNPYNAPKLSN